MDILLTHRFKSKRRYIMKNYKTSNIRNLALVGHSGAGKTALTESLLFKTGVIDKKGKTESGNTVSDLSLIHI